jgi:ribosomal protein S18 acetylase RimI-like enzyme
MLENRELSGDQATGLVLGTPASTAPRCRFSRLTLSPVSQITVRNAVEDERPVIEDLVIAAYEQFTSDLSEPVWRFYKANIERTMEAAGVDQILVAISAGSTGGDKLTSEGFPPPRGEGSKSSSLAGGGIAISSSILGSVLLYKNAEDYLPEWWSVRLLAVSPAARGQGVGRLLMEECVRRSREGGGKVLGLHTTDMMAVARGMYERMGFKRVPELDFQLPENLIKAYRLDL